MKSSEMFAPLGESPCPPPFGINATEDEFQPIIPPPREPTVQELAHRKYGPPVAVYRYTDANNNLEGFVCRYELLCDGEPDKTFTPLRYGIFQGREGYVHKGWGGNNERPLYNLAGLIESPNAPVLVAEGEKAAIGAAKHFPEYVATTPMNGAQSPHLSDWSPLVGHPTIIWADNDAPGRDFARKAAKLLRQAGVTDVRIVIPPPDFPPSWDLGDSLPPNTDAAALRRLLDEAKPYRDPDIDGPDMSILARTARRPPPFPMDVFGQWAPHVKALAEETSTPVDYSAIGLLATAGTLMGTSCIASPWGSWTEYPALWIVGVGFPSCGKSPALSPFVKWLRDFEHEDDPEYAVAHQAWEAECAMASEIREAWKKKTKKALIDGGEAVALSADASAAPEPVRPRLVVSDTTPEALAQVLVGRPGVLAFRDELAGLLAFDRYSTGDSAGRAFWLEAYGGRSYTVDRVKNGGIPIVIEHLLVSVLGGIQPDRLATLILSGEEDGLSARFLYCWPDPIPRRRPTAVVDNTTITESLRKLRNL